MYEICTICVQNTYTKEKEARDFIMGKLIIDGNSIFEIDEECIKEKKIPKGCDIEKYISENYKEQTIVKRKKKATE